MATGSGYSNMQEVFSVLNIPYMSQKLYTKSHDILCEGWEKTAMQAMQAAVDEEIEYANKTGNLDTDGTPLITVVVDGCWSKRSYRRNYSALSGAAAIVGLYTGKVLFISIKNKYCTFCNSKTLCNKEHTCFKNYEGSSTGMESESIVEGFKCSEEMYGVRYSKFITDGDSSTFRKILVARPYNNLVVEKVECRNHLVRNYCNKLKDLTKETRYPIILRKQVGARIMRLRTAVVCAIEYRKKSENPNAAKYLKIDIDNSIHHVFGDHKNCAEYFCKSKIEPNLMGPLAQSTELFNKLKTIISGISNHSKSLLQDVDSNIVEQFNSIICKFVRGKRINFSKKRSYSGRCKAAVVSFNTKSTHCAVYKTLHGKNPSNILRRMEERRRRKVLLWKQKAQERKKENKLTKKTKNMPADKDYGENCLKPDLDPDMFEMEKQNFLNSLYKTDEEIKVLERSTVLQSENSKWFEERRKLLTASSFFSVCNRRDTTSCQNLVKYLLYKSNIFAPSLNHRKLNEKRALQCLSEQENVIITENGLFVDKQHCFLGATPDGLIGDNLIVEVKCPFSASDMSPEEAIRQRRIKFWIFDKKKDEYKINMKDKWYFQIQGQLHVTNKKECVFGVWTGNQYGMKVEYINRRTDFWKKKMEPKLVLFYNNCLLPELVDPRHTRDLPIRDPPYILKAIEKLEEKRKKTKILLPWKKTWKKK